ncbi:MAG: hypothetical protein H7Y09_10825 [Chitinophagaceae bacterium]|nr:hypothetical protein [Anaerolineae bacterium]
MGQDVYVAIRRYFEENGVAYREIEHAPGARTEDYHQALGCRYEQQAKCLFLKVNASGSTSFAICAIPAQKKVNMKAIKRLLSAKDVRFASREELITVTGCDIGELAPVGKLFGVTMLMEADLLHEDEIYLNAGRVDVSFVTDPRALQRVEEPIIFQIEATP